MKKKACDIEAFKSWLSHLFSPVLWSQHMDSVCKTLWKRCLGTLLQSASALLRARQSICCCCCCCCCSASFHCDLIGSCWKLLLGVPLSPRCESDVNKGGWMLLTVSTGIQDQVITDKEPWLWVRSPYYSFSAKCSKVLCPLEWGTSSV